MVVEGGLVDQFLRRWWKGTPHTIHQSRRSLSPFSNPSSLDRTYSKFTNASLLPISDSLPSILRRRRLPMIPGGDGSHNLDRQPVIPGGNDSAPNDSPPTPPNNSFSFSAFWRFLVAARSNSWWWLPLCQFLVVAAGILRPVLLGALNDRLMFANPTEINPRQKKWIEIKSSLVGLLEPLLIGYGAMQQYYEQKLDLPETFYQITSRFDSLQITPRSLDILARGSLVILQYRCLKLVHSSPRFYVEFMLSRLFGLQLR